MNEWPLQVLLVCRTKALSLFVMFSGSEFVMFALTSVPSQHLAALYSKALHIGFVGSFLHLMEIYFIYSMLLVLLTSSLTMFHVRIHPVLYRRFCWQKLCPCSTWECILSQIVGSVDKSFVPVPFESAPCPISLVLLSKALSLFYMWIRSVIYSWFYSPESVGRVLSYSSS